VASGPQDEGHWFFSMTKSIEALSGTAAKIALMHSRANGKRPRPLFNSATDRTYDEHRSPTLEGDRGRFKVREVVGEIRFTPGLPFRSRLRLARKRLGLSVGEFALKALVSARSMEEWEGGRRSPNAKNLLKLTRALGITMSNLLGD